MSTFKITKSGFVGNLSGSVTGSLLGNATTATTASSVAWDDVTSKPKAFPVEDHNHSGSALIPASVSTTGDVSVGGVLNLKPKSTTTASLDNTEIRFGKPDLNVNLKFKNNVTGSLVSSVDIYAPNLNRLLALGLYVDEDGDICD